MTGLMVESKKQVGMGLVGRARGRVHARVRADAYECERGYESACASASVMGAES